mgnify:CR=1 FL=1
MLWTVIDVKAQRGIACAFITDQERSPKYLYIPAVPQMAFYEEYFYWGEQMFYTYVWDGDEKQYFYYQDGLLIRWIDADGKVHDKESDNDKYVELGDKYWSNSVMELQQ